MNINAYDFAIMRRFILDRTEILSSHLTHQCLTHWISSILTQNQSFLVQWISVWLTESFPSLEIHASLFHCNIHELVFLIRGIKPILKYSRWEKKKLQSDRRLFVWFSAAHLIQTFIWIIWHQFKWAHFWASLLFVFYYYFSFKHVYHQLLMQVEIKERNQFP